MRTVCITRCSLLTRGWEQKEMACNQNKFVSTTGTEWNIESNTHSRGKQKKKFPSELLCSTE